MSVLHMAGLLAAVCLIAGISIYSGLHSGSGKKGNGTGIIAGVIMGTLVGGSSTVGTAQLAYNYGMSAWWFTLGGGIACVILALVYAKPFRRSGSTTLIGIISQEYGERAGTAASILNSLGTFINIISQLLSASAVLLVVWPGLGTVGTVAASAVFMIVYVVFGGTKGAGMAGILKLVLIYVSMVLCGIVALRSAGGPAVFMDTVRSMGEAAGVNFFNLFARGAGTDLGSCFSLILGVLTTQTYAQAILSGRDDRSAVKGGLVAACMIPPIGILGILVGLYMRSVTDVSTFAAKTALTRFIIEYLPPLPGGVMLGTLFVTAAGTGAGLALGISSIISNDIIKKRTHAFDSAGRSALLGKVLIVAVLLLGIVFSTGSIGDTILNFAFMSMGLRGAVVFLPVTCAIWMKGRIRPVFALLSILAGPLIVLLFGTVWKGVLPFDALFAGILVSAVIMLCGRKRNTLSVAKKPAGGM